MKSNKIISLLMYVFFPLVTLLFTNNILAADSDSVTATVTPKIISVLLSPTSVDFGVVAVNSYKDTTSGSSGVNTSITATNNGTVAESFGIQGSDSSDWILVPIASHGNAEEFAMEYCNNGTCDATPNWADIGDGTYTTLGTNIALLGTQEFDLRIRTPFSTAITTEQSITITVLATEF